MTKKRATSSPKSGVTLSTRAASASAATPVLRPMLFSPVLRSIDVMLAIHRHCFTAQIALWRGNCFSEEQWGIQFNTERYKWFQI